MGSTFIGIVGGAILSILITIAIEFLRRPRLRLTIEKPCQKVEYEPNTHPASVARYARLYLENKQLPIWARWMLRSPAVQCNGTITFHDLRGNDIFGAGMSVRWAASDQPLAIEGITEDNKRFVVFDPTRLTLTSRIDVYPGIEERQLLDVAVRLDDETDCYGWNNEAYLQPNEKYLWRTPRWRIPPGEYLVKVSISSSGGKCTANFRLINNAVGDGFRIEGAKLGDKSILTPPSEDEI